VRRDIPAQIAYFGGSFTGIDREDMIYLLRVANEFIDAGACESIRISTRPDYIDSEILGVLKKYRVETIELGVQSMDDRVLTASRRGHTAADTERAFSLIKEHGFELVGQMMTGLPASTRETEVMTAEKICAMGADGARIYPTVVFCDTALHGMALAGEYTPFTTEQSVERTAAALAVFLKNEIPVIRVGLQASELLTEGVGVFGGGYHPAVGEMAYARCHRNAVEKVLLHEKTEGKTLILRVFPSDVSAFIGQKGENRKYFIEKFSLRGVKVMPDEAISKYKFAFALV
jgi:histone acetyltransferase (RNA polymerase elongator complex component)